MDEVVCVRLLASIVDHLLNLIVFFIVQVETVGDIVANGAREKHGLLLNDGNLSMEPSWFQLLNVPPVEQNLTFLWVVESLN